MNGADLIAVGARSVKHAVLRTISVLCVLAVILGISFAVWRIFNPKPTQSYAQKANTIQNTEYHNYYTTSEDSFFLGIKLPFFFNRQLKLGVSIPKEIKKKDGNNLVP